METPYPADMVRPGQLRRFKTRSEEPIHDYYHDFPQFPAVPSLYNQFLPFPGFSQGEPAHKPTVTDRTDTVISEQTE